MNGLCAGNNVSSIEVQCTQIINNFKTSTYFSYLLLMWKCHQQMILGQCNALHQFLFPISLISELADANLYFFLLKAFIAKLKTRLICPSKFSICPLHIFQPIWPFSAKNGFYLNKNCFDELKILT